MSVDIKKLTPRQVIKLCKKCGSAFMSYISANRNFCSHVCSTNFYGRRSQAIRDYSVVHRWLNIYYGKANKCEIGRCNEYKKKASRFEWALIKGFSYEKKRENFMMACTMCHRKYDYKEETSKKVSETFRRKGTYNAKPVLQMKNGEVIRMFKSKKEASRELGIHKSSLTQCLKGISRSSGGFQWQYANK